MQDLLTAFDFLSRNIHLAGWVFLIGAAWKLSAKTSKYINSIEDSKKKAELMGETIDKVATNHLPHIQESLDDVNKKLDEIRKDFTDEVKGLRQDLLQVLLSRK